MFSVKPGPWKESLYNTSPWYIGCIVTIFVYRMMLKIPMAINNISVEHTDILNIRLGKLHTISLSGWPLSHFGLFAVLGFIYPESWLFMTVMGILWEIIEHIISIFAPGPEHRPSALNQEKDDETTEYKHWMKGRSEDILFNSAGIITGIGCRALYEKWTS